MTHTAIFAESLESIDHELDVVVNFVASTLIATFLDVF